VRTVLLVQFGVKVDKLEEATTQLHYTVGRQFELQIDEPFSISMNTETRCSSRVFATALYFVSFRYMSCKEMDKNINKLANPLYFPVIRTG
jgi:hypothetical protein